MRPLTLYLLTVLGLLSLCAAITLAAVPNRFIVRAREQAART